MQYSELGNMIPYEREFLMAIHVTKLKEEREAYEREQK